MRGTPYSRRNPSCMMGIIPAHAGNTLRIDVIEYAIGDHPRTCGEHFIRAERACCGKGSSPHMRGTPWPSAVFCRAPGIIPAHAGNTARHNVSKSPRPDHPRTCGEHLPTASVFHPLTGSSPHMRGTPETSSEAIAVVGIIPAHAGNTNELVNFLGIDKDHPRTCGEHISFFVVSGKVLGSSPHMRGTPKRWPLTGIGDGIIPAHAGNTCLKSLRRLATGDHPRTCGEHAALNVEALAAAGSSPHMRGTLGRPCDLFLAAGIIPAHAGNTDASFHGLSNIWDHPRTCGEHDSSI